MPEQTELEFVGKTCGCCGKTAPRLTGVKGTLHCPRCLNNLYFKCGHCNMFETNNSKHSARDSAGYGKYVCLPCFNSHYSKCEHCQYGFRRNDIRVHEGHSYCVFCYDRMFVCVGCRIRQFAENYCDAGLCRVCYDEERRIINPDHLAKAPLEFQGQGPHYYGIELEVECDEKLDRRANYARQILATFNGFAIVKHDGSLKCPKTGKITGFEIVTVPASRRAQMDKWNLFFDKLPKGLRSYDTKTCGLHIHCARKPLSLLTIGKMLLFVNRKENTKFITNIAGRSPNTYCQIRNKTYKDAKPRPQDRYEALNLANKGTVEFRIFRGTLKRESLFKSLEFCDALIHFCGDCCYSVLDSQRVDKFIEYVKLNSKEWPHLWAFISARWLGVENKLTKLYGFPLPDAPAEVENYNNEPNPERQTEPTPANNPIFDNEMDEYTAEDDWEVNN